ncbi:PREDICTED: uncharacterized protein K02A2.6-like isoform X2 [Amphimedon queenslandica]|uniref:Reverse transcriptase n=1 Tax=Amphimedon queenslandica TaxID=400682 RepID=A0AAN0JNE5_AMPQE|nr:PREDICTED: uncharacterized protein K02A2.6-like isoform X2 [Amphimedon queenslandica]|eukprot:XP_019858297.1 PREDICTED: uncharacterized protein K02A2.6-like isoform X2 [Amphimedon queenslandica]
MAENTPYGRLEEFSPEIETFASYSERVELFLQAHAVPDDRQVAVVLNAVGVKNYSLLRGLVAPAKPSEKTVTELLDLLKGHYEPEPVIIAERYHFYTRNQKEEESVAQYAAELRRLASTCSFGDHLDDALRDRLVCGILSAGARKKLLAEKKLKFQGAVAIATNYETIEKDSRSIQQQHESGDAHKVAYKGKDTGDKPCYRCGRQGHAPSTCRFRNARCNNCSKLGHIAAVCRSNQGKKYNRSQGKTHKVDEQADETSGESEDDLGVFQIQSISSHSPPIMISLKLNGQTIEMELDTGASVSLISEEVKDKYLPHVPLQPTHIRLQTYTAQSIKVLGKCQVTVKYGVQEKSLVVIVVAGKRPCLFGRNWLKHIVLDWSSISHVSLAEKQKVDKVCSKYGAVFREETGIMKNFKAKLQLKKDAIPRFHRPRQVPFALKEAVGQELDRLEGCGILEKVKTSEWAAPIVAVPKKDDIDVYPLPNVDEMFAVMAGGEKFTKLDLTNAYQQMELDNLSRDLVTINTHQGLYRYTRLPFGVASAPAVFQRTMDTILQGLDKVVCYIDDILLTGVDDNDHLKTLEAVLQRLQQHGITLKKGYRSTEQHGNADSLSRLPLPHCPKRELDVDTLFNIIHMSSLPLTHSKLKAATLTDPKLSKIMGFIRTGWPQTVDEELAAYWRRRNELSVEIGCLLWGRRVIIPRKLQKQVLLELHTGHPGICRMKSLARSHLWWPNLDADIEQLARSCRPCLEVKSTMTPPPLHPWIWPRKPWTRVHLDFAGPLYGKMYLLAVDACSKWPEVWEMSSTTAKRTVQILSHLFGLYGLPEQIVTDNGPQFVSEEFCSFLRERGVKHFRSAPYHPATNGAVERFVKTFKQALKIGRQEGKLSSQEVIDRFLLQYRSTPHATTLSTPAELFLGRLLRTRLDLMKPEIYQEVERQQAHQKHYFDRRGCDRVFTLGQNVLVREYCRGGVKWSFGQITGICGPLSYWIKLEDGRQVRRHVEQLKKGSARDRVDKDINDDWMSHTTEPQIEESPDLRDETGYHGNEDQGSEGMAEDQLERQEVDTPSETTSPVPRYPRRNRRVPERPFMVSLS